MGDFRNASKILVRIPEENAPYFFFYISRKLDGYGAFITHGKIQKCV